MTPVIPVMPMDVLPPLATVQESCVGPSLLINGVTVRFDLGTSNNDLFYALADQVNRAGDPLRKRVAELEAGRVVIPINFFQLSGFDAEVGRWQDAIYRLCVRLAGDSIDGGGCDSGDPLDFTLAEVSQAIALLTDRAEAAEAKVAELEADRAALRAGIAMAFPLLKEEQHVCEQSFLPQPTAMEEEVLTKFSTIVDSLGALLERIPAPVSEGK
jgi:hypothetical protein